MKRKIRVGIVFGGKSAEHEVSIQSAKNIYSALDKKKYDVVLIGIDKSGTWRRTSEANLFALARKRKAFRGTAHASSIPTFPKSVKFDVVIPVLHGTFGEDGTVQGFFKLSGIPFVGAGVLGSALGMDKDAMKRLLRDAGIPTAKFLALLREEAQQTSFAQIRKYLGVPFFVKPANLGSSVGIHKVKKEVDFAPAIKDASRYDRKIIIESYVHGREIECSVMGNDHPIASIPGEVIPTHEFYSYEAKYLDPDGARLEIPARLDPKTIRNVQELAVRAYTTLCLEGMARVDFFVTKEGNVFINEVNTIPGFTNISMYPKMWEASGISQSKLIDMLIKFAIERFREEAKLKTSFD